jgi:hypothetical protein
MKCSREDCEREAAKASNYCEEHKEFDKANVDTDDDGESGGEGGEGA